MAILSHNDPHKFYYDVTISFTRRISAHALNMMTVEPTTNVVIATTLRIDILEPAMTVVASIRKNLSATMSSKIVWTPIDLIN